MALLQIKSTNPDMGFILAKNPDNGMILRSIRNGMSYGWYSVDNKHEYNIYFKDGDDEVSFDKSFGDYEYNDTSRYNSPMVIPSLLNTYLQHMFNKDSDKDVSGHTHSVIINQVFLRGLRNFDHFKSHFNEYEFNLEELCHKNYRLTISTSDNSLKSLINLVYLFGIFYAFTSIENVKSIQDGDIIKYINVLNNIDAPYFIRYLIKSRLIRSEKVFNDTKTLLESSNKGSYKMVFGDNSIIRRNFIFSKLSLENNVIDIGCNDMRSYGLRLAEKLKDRNLLYYAVDIDDTALENAKFKAEQSGLSNVSFYKDLSFDAVNADIVCSEVIEHMSIDDCKALINSMLRLNYNSIIITTPNKDFNRYYNLEDDDTRLDDHVHEFTKDEFRMLCDEYQADMINVGDTINGEPAIFGFYLKR